MIPFLQDVLPNKKDYGIKDLTQEGNRINEFLDNEINQLVKQDITIINAVDNYSEVVIDSFFSELIS